MQYTVRGPSIDRINFFFWGGGFSITVHVCRVRHESSFYVCAILDACLQNTSSAVK